MKTTRREELLEATAAYLLENGVSNLSLRPLAASIGTRARLLIYHFGSRDALVSAALSVILGRVQQDFFSIHSGATLGRTLLKFWRAATEPANEPYLRLMLEVHGVAFHNPNIYGQYRRESLESWKSLVAEKLDKRKMTRRQREDLATLVIAVVDGLLLDYLATGDLKRTTRALRLFAKSGGIR